MRLQTSEHRQLDVQQAGRQLFDGLSYLLDPPPPLPACAADAAADARDRRRREAEENFAQGLAGLIEAIRAGHSETGNEQPHSLDTARDGLRRLIGLSITQAAPC